MHRNQSGWKISSSICPKIREKMSKTKAQSRVSNTKTAKTAYNATFRDRNRSRKGKKREMLVLLDDGYFLKD